MSRAARNTRLLQLLADIQVTITTERARLTKEAAWMRIIQTRVGLGALQESVRPLNEAAVSKEIEEKLST